MFIPKIKGWYSQNACQNSKQERPRPDCFLRSSLVWACTLHCLSWPFWQATSVQNFRTFTLYCLVWLCAVFRDQVDSFFRGLNLKTDFYTPPLKCGEVLCYTLRCPSVRPSAPFPIDNLSIYSRNFFKFCIHIVIGDEWYGIVNGQNPSIFNGVTALFRIGKMVSGLLFLYYSWYLNETSQICCTSKVTYCD